MFGRGPGRGKGRFMAGGPGQMRHWMAEAGAFLQGIDLSEEQIEKIAELKHRGFSKMGHARVDMMELRHQLLQELAKEKIDRAQIDTLKSKIKEHKSQMTETMIDHMTEFAEILTAEQRKKIRLRKMKEFMGASDEQEHGPPWGAPPWGPPPPPPPHREHGSGGF